MDCIKKKDLIRRILIIVICLLVMWPFLWRSCSVFAFEVLPKEPIIFEQDPNRESNKKLNTRVASNGEGYLCIWQEKSKVTGEDILGQRVDPNGSLQGDFIKISISSRNEINPDLDSDGNSYLVVWSDKRDPNTTDIYAALVNPDGSISKEITIENGLGDLRFPKVKWNGLHYLVAWEDWDNPGALNKVSIYGKRVDPNGQVIDQEREEIAADFAFNKLGKRASFDLGSLEDPNMGSWLIVWNGNLQDPAQNGFDILGKVLYEDPNAGISSSPFPLQITVPMYPTDQSLYSSDQYHPSLEGMDNNYLLVFENWIEGEETINKDILGIRLNAFGNRLGYIIGISLAQNNQTFPEVTTNDRGYFVIWLDKREDQVEQVYGIRVSPEGIFLQDDPNTPANTPIGTRISDDPNQVPYFPAAVSTGLEKDDRYFCFWSAREGTVQNVIGRTYYPPPSPELDWVGSSNYVQDGVDPDAAPGGSQFTFKVKYFSPEEINEKPEIAQIWIDLDDNGSAVDGEIFEMEVEGGSVTDYTKGVVYSYEDLKILYDGNDGILSYRFFFMDKYNVATGEPRKINTFQVDLVGNQPILDWTYEPGFTEDGARPDGAEWDTNTTFEFHVIYRDEDDNEPQHMELWIDKNADGLIDPNHERLDMDTDGSSYQQGQIYYKETVRLTPGLNTTSVIFYKFESDDGKNKAIGVPRSGSYLSLNPLGESSACLNIYNQLFPSITSTGSGYQVFWQDQREIESDANDVPIVRNHIWMELLSEAGQVKDGPGEPGQKRIDNSINGAFKPLAQFNSETQRTLLVWEDIRHGSIIEPSGYEENIFKPESIYDGLDIFGIFIDPNGDPVIDPNDPNSKGEFPIGGETSPKNMLNPDMALGENGQYLIVWESESRLDSETEKTEIWARFVRYPEGAYGDRIWIQIAVEGREWPGEGHQLMPKVAWNGEYYLAIWQDVASVDLRTGYYYSRIYGTRIDPNGELYPPISIDEITGQLLPGTMYAYKFFNESQELADPNINQLFPDIASDGENFLIVWQDSRHLGTDGGYDIYGMRVNVNGDAIQYLDDPYWEIPICTADGHQLRPRVFWDSQESQYIITWLEISYEVPPGYMLLHRMSLPSQRIGGDIKVARMDPNGQLLDSSPGEEDKYEGTSLVGLSSTQDHPDMVCDPNLGCRVIWEDVRNTVSYDLYTASYQSTLNWAGDPNFENSGVHPIQGAPGDAFTFKVEYRDRLDSELKDSQVWIDLNDNGKFGEEEKFEMNAFDPNSPISLGMIYTFTREIDFPQKSDGQIAYRFYFKNEKDQKVQGLGSGINFLSLKITEAPQLDWAGGTEFTADGVNPDQGDSGSLFTFKVKYTDPSNIEPVLASVWIDLDDNGQYSESYEMFVMEEEDPDDKDYSDGKVYIYALTISYQGDGIINYRFYFHNGAFEAEGEPASDHTFQINKPLKDLMWKTYFKEDGLAGNIITSLEIDKDNILWAGSYAEFKQEDEKVVVVPDSGGVSRFDGQTWNVFRGTEYLPSNFVTSLAITPGNDLWVAVLGGLSLYNGTEWKKLEKDPNAQIRAIASDKDGHLWVAIDPTQDPNTLEISGGKLEKYNLDMVRTYDYSSKDKFEANIITALSVDKESLLWAGIADASLDPNNKVTTEYKGIVVFDPTKGEVVKTFTKEDYKGGNWISKIYCDDSGDIWIGSYSRILEGTSDYQVPRYEGAGLSYYSPAGNSSDWTRYIDGEAGVNMGSNIITAIYGRGNELWIGHAPESESLPGGATRHDLSSNGWQVFNTSNVPYVNNTFNSIFDIVIADNNIVWFATQNGLVRYNPAGELPEEYIGPYRGLDPNEESGCFISRTGMNNKVNNSRTIILFTLIMCIFLLLVGLLCRRHTINIKNKKNIQE